MKTHDFGRLKETELTVRGRTKDIVGASQASNPSVSQSRREKLPDGRIVRDVQLTVPVLGSDPVKKQTFPLMPCHPARARQLIKKKGAKRRWFKGIFCIQLVNKVEKNVQQIVCGIDAGMKREGFTVQSKSHTYLNVLSDAVTGITDRLKIKRSFRVARRGRKCPCRAPRPNRLVNSKWVAPSIRSRWNAKLRIVNFLRKLYPISDYMVEDIKAKKVIGATKWNKIFSVLELGKTEFYKQLSELGKVTFKRGFETAEERNRLGLKKLGSKLADNFYAHNVDSWVLASFITGKAVIDNENVFRMLPLRFIRRKLHSFWNKKGGIRDNSHGSMVAGFKRGSVIKHCLMLA